MPLTRYLIRNEFSLADPELYRAADKDDPEALLEGVAMAGLVGVLRQLGDLAEFAAELFHDLHEEVMVTAARGHGLMNRLQQLEADVPLIEKAFLSQTSQSLYLHNTGTDWHQNLQMNQNLVTRGDLPRFVMDSYEECRGPPRLFLLDKFDIAGAGACLKRYTDPSFFKELSSSETTFASNQREKKSRKIKKKASPWRNGETPEAIPTSHSKLHQLLSEENSQTEKSFPTHHVKLKRRQPSCSLVDTTGKSYMERFLDTCSFESKLPYESSVSPLRLMMEPCNSGELIPEIHEVYSGSPEIKLGKRDRSPASSPSREEKLLGKSFEVGEAVIEDKKEPVVDEDIKTESADGYRSEDITSEMDSYVDALAIMEPEMETDTERRKNDRDYCNIEMKREDDTYEESQKLQAQLSVSHSNGSSIGSDDGDNSFKEERFSLSHLNTPNSLTENVPSGGDAAAKVHPSTEIFSGEIIDTCSEKHFDNGDIVKPTSPERVVQCGPYKQVSDPNYTSESGKASCDSSLADSTHAFTRSSPGESDSKFQLAGPDLTGVSSDFSKLNNMGSSPNAEDDGKSSDGDLPCVSCDDTLVHPSKMLDLECENKDGDGATPEILPKKDTDDISVENLLNGELDVKERIQADRVHLSCSEEESNPPLDFPSKCTKSDTPESASVEEVNSQLTHLVNESIYKEAVDEDTLMGHNELGSPCENNSTLQNGCNSNGDSDQEKLEATEASIERHLIGPGTQKGPTVDSTSYVLDQSNSESSKPSGFDLFNDIHDPLMVERAQKSFYLSDGTNDVLSLRESDSESEPKQLHKSHLSDSAEEAMLSANHSLLELEDRSENGLEVTDNQFNTCSLPEDEECIELSKSVSERPESPNQADPDGCNSPSKYTSIDPLGQPSEPRFSLFPTSHKEDMQQLQQGSVTSDEEMHEPSSNLFLPVSPTATEKEGHQGFPALDGEIAEPLNPLIPLPTTDDEKPQQGPQMLVAELQPHNNPYSSTSALEHEMIEHDIEGETARHLNPFLPLPAIEDEKPQHGSFTSGVEMQPSLVQPCLTSGDEVTQPLSSSKPIPIRDDEKQQNIYIPLQGLAVQPLSSFMRPPSIEDDKLKHDSLNLEEEMTNDEDGKPNGIPRTRLLRPRDPLIDAVASHVASHDKSMLRKVSERVMPQLAPKVDERNSLLEQIRNKSFNLKPAVATRPSIQGPRTNLKLVAILEKANAIRQALAGSDDDDDEDSWSDS